MNIKEGTIYYYKGFGAPFQRYTITKIEPIYNNHYAQTRVHTTESSGGVNNEMYKWFNLTDFEKWIWEGKIVILEG